MKKILLGCAAIVALIGTPALAADMPLKALPPPAPIASWTGCYVGGEVGGAWGDSQHSFSNGAPTDTAHPTGVVGGGLLGCNYQVSSVVFGIEGDFEGAGVNGGGFVNLTGATSSGSDNMTSDGSVRARIGGVVWDRSLLYVTAGWAFAHYSTMGGPGPGFGVPVPCCGFSGNPDGWTLGVGWEYEFAPSWSARVEYRHSDFGVLSGALVPSFPTVTMSVRNAIDAVRFGLTYRFTMFGH
jgi:outer membrane immunogenic protein